MGLLRMVTWTFLYWILLIIVSSSSKHILLLEDLFLRKQDFFAAEGIYNIFVTLVLLFHIYILIVYPIFMFSVISLLQNKVLLKI